MSFYNGLSKVRRHLRRWQCRGSLWLPPRPVQRERVLGAYKSFLASKTRQYKMEFRSKMEFFLNEDVFKYSYSRADAIHLGNSSLSYLLSFKWSISLCIVSDVGLCFISFSLSISILQNRKSRTVTFVWIVFTDESLCNVSDRKGCKYKVNMTAFILFKSSHQRAESMKFRAE